MGVCAYVWQGWWRAEKGRSPWSGVIGIHNLHNMGAGGRIQVSADNHWCMPHPPNFVLFEVFLKKKYILQPGGHKWTSLTVTVLQD